MYKVIVVAIDGSDTSRDALNAAVSAAEQNNATLFILYVADESFIYYGGPGFDCCAGMDLLREEGKKILANAKEVLAKHPSVHYDTILFELRTMQGRVADAIIEKAEELKAELIVVGSHGRRGFSRLFLGSVAENVMRLSTVPVLLIKSNPKTPDATSS